ncbi:hypothetical protein BJ508DRAFT_313259 [Ascobolus immersus RN42]|uniref:Uncharacterized protein n=1 Tax=Ascobolus immersus RN42 TaxID=1160509 RepID=A0A3N4HPP6_ASCIM|nr:hypothetical protein BJ508DRAFT_313259 [Ascobolus immersus RN42]
MTSFGAAKLDTAVRSCSTAKSDMQSRIRSDMAVWSCRVRYSDGKLRCYEVGVEYGSDELWFCEVIYSSDELWCYEGYEVRYDGDAAQNWLWNQEQTKSGLHNHTMKGEMRRDEMDMAQVEGPTVQVEAHYGPERWQ